MSLTEGAFRAAFGAGRGRNAPALYTAEEKQAAADELRAAASITVSGDDLIRECSLAQLTEWYLDGDLRQALQTAQLLLDNPGRPVSHARPRSSALLFRLGDRDKLAAQMELAERERPAS